MPGATASPLDGCGQLPAGSTVDGLRRNICTRLRIFSDSVKSSDAQPATEKRLIADGEEGVSIEESPTGHFYLSKSVFLTVDLRVTKCRSACITALLRDQGTGVQWTFEVGESLQETGGHAAGASTTRLVKRL